MIYIFLIIIFFIFALIFVFYPPIASIFPKATDKATVIQTNFTILTSILGFIGVYEILKKFNQKYNPVLLVNGEDKKAKITTNYFPIKVELNFYVWNKGKITINKKEVNYKIIFPDSIPVKVTDGIALNSTEKIIPSIKNYSKKGFISVGGDIPVRVYPLRKRQIFKIEIEIKKPKTFEVLYYFTSDVGLFPKNIKLDDNDEPYKNLGKIEIAVSNS